MLAAAGPALWPIVIGAGAALLGAGVAVLGNRWTATTTARLDREGRMFDRRADAYVDLIRMANHLTDMTCAVVRRRPAAPGPSDEEREVLSARVAAYGSPAVRLALAELIDATVSPGTNADQRRGQANREGEPGHVGWSGALRSGDERGDNDDANGHECNAAQAIEEAARASAGHHEAGQTGEAEDDHEGARVRDREQERCRTCTSTGGEMRLPQPSLRNWSNELPSSARRPLSMNG
jgi:hypothetical protein